MIFRQIFQRLFILVVLVPFVAGCTHQSILVESEPSGADVYFDGKPKGQTPVEFPFKWYGGHKIVLRKEGYREVRVLEPIRAPFHYQVPLDLVTELIPARIADQQKLYYELEPLPPEPAMEPPRL